MPKNFIPIRYIENTIPKARILFQYKACLIYNLTNTQYIPSKDINYGCK